MARDVDDVNSQPLAHVTYPDKTLGELLLTQKLVAYHDDNFGVTSGEHKIIFSVLKDKDFLIAFYTHVPFAYPIPDGVKKNITEALQNTLGKDSLKIKFVNAAVEYEKKDIKFRTDIGG